MLQVGDDVLEVVVDHLCDPFNGFEFAAACPPIPLLEELARTYGITVVPEVIEGFFEGIRPPHL